jgi:hypothetical protein
MFKGLSTTGVLEKPSAYGPTRPPTPRHPPNYGIRTNSHPKPHIREDYWDKDDSSTLQLQGLPPRPPMPKMGHSVIVQGGSPPIPRDAPAKLSKASSSKNSSTKSGGRRSNDEKERRGLDVGITRTYDFRTYSDYDLTEISFYEAETNTSSPLDREKSSIPPKP